MPACAALLRTAPVLLLLATAGAAGAAGPGGGAAAGAIGPGGGAIAAGGAGGGEPGEGDQGEGVSGEGDAMAEAAADPVGSRAGEILVIGSRERLLDIAGSGSIVGPEEFARTRPFTVNDVLRLVPGIFPRDEEGLGARANIGVRGLNPVRSTKILLLEDGIPLGFAPYGDNASYYHPPIERYERVEVLKGASQIRFGPQTIGGVVNYITPAPPETLAGRLSARGGNRRSTSVEAQAGAPFPGGGAIVQGTYKEGAGVRANQLLRFADLFGKLVLAPGPGHELAFKASGFLEDSFVTYSGLTRAEFAADPRGNPFPKGNDRFETWRLSATVGWTWEPGPGARLQTTGYWHRFSRDWWRQSSNSLQRPNDASDPACGGMANLLTACGTEGRLRDYDTVGIEARLLVAHDRLLGGAPRGETEIGLRVHREEQRRRQWNADTPRGRTPGTGVNGGVRENNARDATALSAFVASRFEFGRFALMPGLRAEFIEFERRNLPIDVIAGGRPTGATTAETRGRARLDKLIPGIGATLDLADGLVLYGGVHRGFAPPRVEDIITPTGGSVDLDAELSWDWEIGVRGSPAPGLRLDATAFVMDFGNQIVPQSVAGGVGATLTSAGRTLHRGAELALALSSAEAGVLPTAADVFARAAITWVPTARYASTRLATPPCFDGRARGDPVETGSGPRPCGIAFNARGNRLPYAPEWLVSAAVGVAAGGFTAQVEVVGQSAMYADDANLVPVTPDGQRGRIGGWAVLNATLAWEAIPGRLELFATGRNLLDRLYVSDRSRGILPGPPRIVQAGATVRF